jgi:hypothetical protein
MLFTHTLCLVGLAFGQIPASTTSRERADAQVQVVETDAPVAIHEAWLAKESNEIVISLDPEIPRLKRLAIVGHIFGQDGTRLGGFSSYQELEPPVKVEQVRRKIDLPQLLALSPFKTTLGKILVTIKRVEFLEPNGLLGRWELDDETLRNFSSSTLFASGSLTMAKAAGTPQNIDWGQCCISCRGDAASACGYPFNSRGDCATNYACVNGMSCPYNARTYTFPSPTGHGTITVTIYECSCDFTCAGECCT